MIDILLVEDDPALGRGLAINLEHEGFRVHLANQLQSALSITQTKKFGLVLLDLGLPDGSGLQFLKETRQSGSSVPIIILTAKTDVDSVVQGLQLGANDYVRKPFDDRELFARIRTLIRAPQSSPVIQYGDLSVHPEKRKVYFEDKEVTLSPREFDILSHFVRHAELVVTRANLLDAVDKDVDLFERTIDSNISHIRTRLRKAGVHSIQISPIYGIGYRLEKV